MMSNIRLVHLLMGLEQVELVMDVEEHFGIDVPDEAVERVRTVADFAAVVISLLPKPPCATGKAFYEFRRLLVKELGIERQRIRPSTKLDEIIPRERRVRWSKLASKDSRLPQLVLFPGAKILVIAIAIFAVMSALWLSYLVWIRFDLFVSLLMIVLLVFFAAVAIAWLHERLAGEFPTGIVTVGDVVRKIAPMDAGQDGSGERLIAQQKVLEDVRRLTAEAAGLPLEKVRPESDFVKDLGLG